MLLAATRQRRTKHAPDAALHALAACPSHQAQHTRVKLPTHIHGPAEGALVHAAEWEACCCPGTARSYICTSYSISLHPMHAQGTAARMQEAAAAAAAAAACASAAGSRSGHHPLATPACDAPCGAPCGATRRTIEPAGQPTGWLGGSGRRREAGPAEPPTMGAARLGVSVRCLCTVAPKFNSEQSAM